MAIPDYQSIMLPLLIFTTDQQEHKIRDLTAILADQFALSTEERKTLIPSRTQSLFYNRRTQVDGSFVLRRGIEQAGRSINKAYRSGKLKG